MRLSYIQKAVARLDDWLFLGEQSEAGIVYQLGVNRRSGERYRFEPLATRLKNGMPGLLRQTVEGRRIASADPADPEPGIMPVAGLFFRQDRYWLGWEDRRGVNLFSAPPPFKVPLRDALSHLYPLIHSYRLWHRAGFTVGRPEWPRLAKDEKGIFTPDPKVLSYLAQPCHPLPAALEHCRPPEEYRGQSLGMPGDIFYLGLIIYSYLSGKIPYLLQKGWPTWAILAGRIVPLEFHRPEAPPELGQLIASMLAPDPMRRPPLKTVAETWSRILKGRAIQAPLYQINLQRQRRFKRKQLLLKSGHRYGLPLLIVFLLIFVFKVFCLKPVKHHVPNPLKATADFYRQVQYPYSNVSRNRNGIRLPAN